MTDTPITLKIMDIVSGTSTNNEGIPLFLELDKYLSSGRKVRLSMADATSFSTSFLNSSIGDVIDKYGYEHFRKMVVFTQFRPAQVKYLQMYFDQVTS
jgi:chromosome condensin MukBEF MukE localization factor